MNTARSASPARATHRMKTDLSWMTTAHLARARRLLWESYKEARRNGIPFWLWSPLL